MGEQPLVTAFHLLLTHLPNHCSAPPYTAAPTCIAETFPKLARPDRWGESGDCYLLNILHVLYTFCPKTKLTQWLWKMSSGKGQTSTSWHARSVQALDWNSHSFECQCLELRTKLNSKRMKAQKTALVWRVNSSKKRGKNRKNHGTKAIGNVKKHKRQQKS